MIKIFIFICTITNIYANAQVGIGTSNPNKSSILELQSSNKGLLPPRILLSSRLDTATIKNPAVGLFIYNTSYAGVSPNNVTPGFYYFDGSKWQRVINQEKDQTVSFNTVDPNSNSTVFTPNTSGNNDCIYNSEIDGSLWVWNDTNYITYTPASNTAWYSNGSTNDAGSNKSSAIYRTGQIGVGTISTLDNSAQLQINSTEKGLLPPRMTKIQRDAIVTPATGLLVYCLDCNTGGSGCLSQNNGTSNSPSWECVGASSTPSISANCSGFSGLYTNGTALSGASYSVVVTNNSFNSVTIGFAAADITLTGISGLTVGTPTASPALSSGSILLGAGGIVTVTYPITGTPGARGTLTGTYNKLGLTCSKSISVTNPLPTFNCNNLTLNSNNFQLTNGTSYSGTLTIPYTAVASGEPYPSQNISSSGLSFSRSSGTYSLSGNITYSISGTYTGLSNNVFTISLDSYAGSCSTYIFDRIRNALASAGCGSCTSYDAAATNDVVQITKSEFDSLTTKISGVTNYGRKSADDNKSAPGTSGYSNYMFNNNITTGAYPFAFSTYLGTFAAGVKLIKQSANSIGGSAVIDFSSGACKVFSGQSVAALYYFVLKRPNVSMPANTNIAVHGYWAGWGSTSGGNGLDGVTSGPSGVSAGNNSTTCTTVSSNVSSLPIGTVNSSYWMNYNIKWTNTKQW